MSRAAQRDALLQAAIDFVGTLTGMTPPPIEVAPPQVFAPFREFVSKVEDIVGTDTPDMMDGGSAFPMQDAQAIHAYALGAVQDIADTDERDRVYTAARAAAVGGMSLRDHFAGLALQAAISGHISYYGHESNHWSVEAIASHAYEQADAMLKARAR